MTPKRDKIAEIKERLLRIADRDTRIVMAMSKFAEEGMSADELALIADLPKEHFPCRGFATKKEARIAWYATLPRKAWPAAMQSAHERVSYVQRAHKSDDGKQTINLQVISIPAAIDASPAQDVLRFRRTKKGKLRPIIDVAAIPGALPAIQPDEEEDLGE